jgi:hypothetical protein
MLLGPAAALAHTPNSCQCGKPTPQSYKWDFPKEASQLFNRIEADSFQIRDAADTLEIYNRDTNLVGWEGDATVLAGTIPKVQALDQMGCRLRIIQRVTTPEQQATINRIVPQIIELTDTMNATIHYFNRDRDRLWTPRYTAYATEIRNCANQITEDLRNPGKIMATHRAPANLSKP